jgi:hypothetical protein
LYGVLTSIPFSKITQVRFCRLEDTDYHLEIHYESQVQQLFPSMFESISDAQYVYQYLIDHGAPPSR